ncbi:asparagine synthase (glutamine-hydrolyzing) [Algoriphagus sp. AK58]|uniref:asparagine synthase (glutamine-hydrolyzing) n=1 Tax=Algoriphagus sp. AK58 TaxID=1406877 RepID=UPI00164FB763|nr:asparagine synthase (glutamine-hydrolyzing) [Algoriphagus sp. AK58]MBC6365736.1 asparagine synthase (glutamine-hydrolyzing) [Algoriphagus sp. AK58]
MCGIHLIWGKGANERSIQTLVTGSRHRGPDQEAVYSPWPGLWIGVNRLRILHPGPDADQPFWTQDGTGLLIWNGEIYNFKDLRNVLRSLGVEVLTQSDTEVLVYYLKFFGIEGFKKIQGMFAFIFVDLVTKTVLVARDPNGEKPLYFSQSPDTLIISSESRGIARLSGSEVDLGQLNNYFYFRNPAPGKTFYKGVRAWKPGRYSQIHHHNTFRWDTLKIDQSNEDPLSKELFRDTLEKVILNQFHADVPVGVMLSGGMDSSLLYALWYRQTGTPLPAFTIQVEKQYRKKYADGDAASRFTQTIPADHQLVEIDQKTVLDHWHEFILSVDQPIGDSAGFLTWMIGKKAKDQVKVLASGAGADELWGGYQRHKAFHQYLESKNFWITWAPLLKNLPFGRSWKKFNSGIRTSANETFLNFSALSNPKSELLDDYLRIMDADLPEYKRALDFDRQLYLVQDILKIQDNALMAHGIEGRSPYLDHQLIQLWKKVEDTALLRGKPWIVSCLEDLELTWITERKKSGFGLPLLEWLSENGPFAKKVFSALKEFGVNYRSELPIEIFQLTQNPHQAVKYQFLSVYNLFLFAEWLKLHKP